MRIVIAVLALLLVIVNYQLWLAEDRGVPKVRLLQETIAEQQAENAALAERNHALAAEVASLKGGLEAIEERARTELGMIRRDETFYHILDEPPPGLDLEHE